MDFLTKHVGTNAKATLGHTHRESMLFYTFLSMVMICVLVIGELVNTYSHHIPARIPSEASYLQLNVSF